MKKTSVLLGVLVCVGLVSTASGAMSITNGDFQTGLTGDMDAADVVGWYDSDANAFWQTPWIKDGGDSFNGGAIVVFSASQVGSAIDGAGLLGYLYQNIGTADGALEVKIASQSASPDDYGVTVTILQSDGSVVFSPGEEVDVLGAAGMTVIDQQTQLYTGAANDGVQDEVWTFDLSSVDAADGDLYLRFNHYVGGWVGIDNIAVVGGSPGTVLIIQ
jgi:hypothetical protein